MFKKVLFVETWYFLPWNDAIEQLPGSLGHTYLRFPARTHWSLLSGHLKSKAGGNTSVGLCLPLKAVRVVTKVLFWVGTVV